MAREYPPNPAPELVAEGATLAEIAEEAEGCVSCDLYERATQTVFGEGMPGATFLLVGEQPGDQEDKEGAPFVGPAGRLLDRALEEAGIDRDEAYVTNVVKHFKWKAGGGPKPRLHAKPNRGEILACRPWLDAEIIRVDPAVVVCLGATAAQSLLGKDIRVTRDHGVPLELDGRLAVATIHPSAVLRATDDDRQARFDQLVADLSVAVELSHKG
ncbi:MAG TPA: UdgX family uracil-DNA binding protein [Acidimicrobiia bacterium]|nr:UdgX family uracil-DNA binding protein [Acidimicrobiia bacterium]